MDGKTFGMGKGRSCQGPEVSFLSSLWCRTEEEKGIWGLGTESRGKGIWLRQGLFEEPLVFMSFVGDFFFYLRESDIYVTFIYLHSKLNIVVL